MGQNTKRYIIESSFYVWAANEVDALGQGAELTERINKDFSERAATVDAVYLNNFGSLEVKKVIEK